MRKWPLLSQLICSFCLCMSLEQVFAADFTWIGNTNDYALGTNWNPAGPPTFADRALFTSSGLSFTPTVTSLQSSQEIEFQGTSAYNFLVGGNLVSYTLLGTGVTNSSSVPQQATIQDSAFLSFRNTASADSTSAGNITYNLNDGFVSFLDSASASKGKFNLDFGIVSFLDTSTALLANISSTNQGGVFFRDSSTAANAVINIKDGIQVGFFNDSSAASSTINLDKMSLLFLDNSSAALSTISIINNTLAQFGNAASAGSAVINSAGSIVGFLANSTATSAIFNLTSSSNISFTQSSTAANSIINLDNNSQASFFLNSTAASSIINANSSRITLIDTATAASSIINCLNNSSLIFFGNSTGANATVNLVNGSSLTINQNNTLGFLSGDATSTVNLNSFNLAVGSNNVNSTIAGIISGAGGSLSKVGTAALSLLGANTYSGGTTVANGTLIGNTTSLQGSILNNANLIFDQPLDGTFNGTLSGNGNIHKIAAGKLSLISDNSFFTGTTNIDQGALVLNGVLFGDLFVNSGTRISGTGTAQNLTIHSGATIAPGNSIGTMTVAGNYVQQAGSTYEVQVDGLGNNTLIDVRGTATLNGGDVVVTGFDVGTNQAILHADGGLTGTFSNLIFTQPYATGQLTYDPFNAFLNFRSNFAAFAKTINQKHVARQIDSITTPNADELSWLAELSKLDVHQLRHALNQMSGEQYTYLIQLTQLANRRFVRTLYEPLRYKNFTAYDPCDECCTANQGLEVWFEIDGGRGYLSKTQNAKGFTMNSFELSAGAQTDCIVPCLTLGAAINYEHDHINFKVGGRGKNDFVEGAIYSYFDTPCFYLLADITGGYNNSKVKRPIHFGTIDRKTHANTGVYVASLYSEAGTTYEWNGLYIQPFLGLEFGYYNRNSLRENGADTLDLKVHSRSNGNVDSRLGVHLAANAFCDVVFSADAAWQHQYTTFGNKIRNRFIAFGDTFSIFGVDQNRDGFEGAFNVSKTICDNYRLYAEFSGEKWGRFSNYEYSFGVLASW